MRVLVLGRGGREHALAWRIAQDPGVEKVHLHPGNAGTHEFSSLQAPMDPGLIATEARALGITLIVIGPEDLLAEGWADIFRSEDLSVVGPGTSGARLETSKDFAKSFMREFGIPTAQSHTVHNVDELMAAVTDLPIVLKLDGLASGKGVVIAENGQDVSAFIHSVWKPVGGAVVVEQFLAGVELSYIVLTDGSAFVPLSSASDYKRVHEADQGPNTGGMGCVSPSPYLSPTLQTQIHNTIVEPTLAGLKARGIDYRGALYFGILVDKALRAHVLEFNTRFGDPETQALMLRLKGDFTGTLLATAEHQLQSAPALHWSDESALYVVGAAQGYPGQVRTGDLIEGLDQVGPEVTVFCSGVTKTNSGLATGGGRVLGLGAVAKDLTECRAKVYGALSKVHWAGMHYRRDLGLPKDAV